MSTNDNPETPAPKPDRPQLIPNRLYDWLKYITTIGLPAVGTLYFAIAEIWEFPRPYPVLGTISAVTTFLGLLLGLSTKSYNNSSSKYDGTFIVNDPDHEQPHVFDVISAPNDMAKKKELSFKVINTQK